MEERRLQLEQMEADVMRNWATEQLLCRNLWEESEKLKSAGPSLALKEAN